MLARRVPPSFHVLSRLLLAGLLLSPHTARRNTFMVSPRTCFEPCSISIRATVEEGSRATYFVAGANFESYSDAESDGHTRIKTFVDVPAGDYEAGIMVDGVLRDHEPVQVIPRFGE